MNREPFGFPVPDDFHFNNRAQFRKRDHRAKHPNILYWFPIPLHDRITLAQSSLRCRTLCVDVKDQHPSLTSEPSAMLHNLVSLPTFKREFLHRDPQPGGNHFPVFYESLSNLPSQLAGCCPPPTLQACILPHVKTDQFALGIDKCARRVFTRAAYRDGNATRFRCLPLRLIFPKMGLKLGSY